MSTMRAALVLACLVAAASLAAGQIIMTLNTTSINNGDYVEVDTFCKTADAPLLCPHLGTTYASTQNTGVLDGRKRNRAGLRGAICPR